jgi:hypothetical protein
MIASQPTPIAMLCFVGAQHAVPFLGNTPLILSVVGARFSLSRGTKGTSRAFTTATWLPQ